jgi:hypothetical protein
MPYRVCAQTVVKTQDPLRFAWPLLRESNPISKLRDVAQFRHKYAVGCALEVKMQITKFAQFAQNYAVPVSEFVRKNKCNLWRPLPSDQSDIRQMLSTSPDRTRIVFDCRITNHPARMTSTRTAHVYEVRPRKDKRGVDLGFPMCSHSVGCGMLSR